VLFNRSLCIGKIEPGFYEDRRRRYSCFGDASALTVQFALFLEDGMGGTGEASVLNAASDSGN
jgi:hypothetical protein